jgi:hypothetical protein
MMDMFVIMNDINADGNNGVVPKFFADGVPVEDNSMPLQLILDRRRRRLAQHRFL